LQGAPFLNNISATRRAGVHRFVNNREQFAADLADLSLVVAMPDALQFARIRELSHVYSLVTGCELGSPRNSAADPPA
jgi:hypothetical protein